MSKSLNIQTNDFDSWFDSVNLNMEFWESPVRAARFGYEAGQQSRQAEIDELNLKINRLIESEENIARSCKGWRDSHRELDERIIKVLTMLEDEAIEVDYDEYRFVGNFVDADKLKEILK